MKKIVISTIPTDDRLVKRLYPVDGNALIQVDEPVYYAVNSALANNLEKDDDVKVILIGTTHDNDCVKKNINIFIEELNYFNKVGANISEAVITRPFDESKTNFRYLYESLLDELEEDAELYVDITFGPKTPVLLIFSVLQFAEKFFHCTIGNIVYSKVIFKPGSSEVIPGTEMIYDITPLYMLNSITNIIECSGSEKAVKAVKALFQD
ncbi:TM1812 family CRISPR-associated protein [Treponema sp. OMZ 788]|uniref:TM1812 family CRISPR-associated protein n=1 Tax=Treponema sp. OMZ 788 TaxID=2563664 RepID=UPI0020A2577D|nr:TM1812 family CRISPR-associated protein [Treponema sp. OMZ 788]UTC64535.1 TM1812 family CRISPR-associated protein [Treponema sp. OMZ 788]